MKISEENSSVRVFRTNSIHLRCTAEEYEAFQQAAKDAGTSLNNFITAVARDDTLLQELVSKVKGQKS